MRIIQKFACSPILCLNLLDILAKLTEASTEDLRWQRLGFRAYALHDVIRVAQISDLTVMLVQLRKSQHKLFSHELFNFINTVKLLATNPVLVERRHSVARYFGCLLVKE